MTTNLTNQLMRATVSKFEAERHEALARVQLYLEAPVAVGEHPHLVGDLATAVADLAAAEEALDSIQRNFIVDASADENE